MKLSTRLAPEPFDPTAELKRLMTDVDGKDGAIASFVGIARAQGKDGTPILRLFLDHHPRLTQRSIEEIGRAAGEYFPIDVALIIHRCGDLHPGEPIVLAAAASKHRRAAFKATEYMMDRLKTDAIFWKREDGVDGSRWIEPTEADHRDRARWSDRCRD